MTANTWPDKPGVPLNPERDGWHWLDSFNREKTIVFWHGENQGNEGHWEGYPLWIAQDWVYLGPVLTPDEAAALQKRVAELEKALKINFHKHVQGASAADVVITRILPYSVSDDELKRLTERKER